MPGPHREATKEELAASQARELELFHATINPCESIPPRHSPYVAFDGRTYCTRCGEEIQPMAASIFPCDGGSVTVDDGAFGTRLTVSGPRGQGSAELRELEEKMP
jgi:hypothetical protein